MTFKHKLSCRLALLKDALLLVPAVLLASCDLRRNVADPTGNPVTAVVVVPDNIMLDPLQSFQFRAVGRTPAGDSVAANVTWTASAGSITQNALFTADSSENDVIVTATWNQATAGDPELSGTARVGKRRIVAILLTPASVTLPAGGVQQFTARGVRNIGDTVATSVNFTVTGGTITPGGLYTAGSVAGSYRVIAARPNGSLADTSVVTVTSVPVASVSVSPASASLTAGATAQLTATTQDASGNVLTGRSISWASNATGVATVSASGLVRALTAGSATITAASEGKSGTAAVTVTVAPPAPVASVTVTPSTASVPAGSAVQLVAVARDSAGIILQGRLMSWRSGDSLVAKVSAVGLVTALAAGGTFVIATSEGRSDTAQVTVTVPPPPDTTLGVALPPRLAVSTGQTFYVAPGGSDANPGTAAAPWRTLQHAMDALAPGQRALVRAGTYETGGTFGTDADTYQWRAACSAVAPCTIAAYPGEQPVIHGMLKISGSFLRLSGFIIEGPLSRDVTSASERRANQIDLSDAHDVELSGNEIRNNDYHAGITAYRVYNIHVIGNWIHDNGRFTIEADPQTGSSTFNVDHGVYWGSTSGGGNLIANNLIEHNRGNGLQLYPNTYDVIVTENTIVNNGNTGVYVGGSADRITVVNNISAFNERNGQMRIKSGTANVVRGNLVYSPTSSWNGIENTTGISVSDNAIADPAFANRLGGDFRLTAASPALDRALAAYALVLDYLGVPRPRGAGADLGAYER